MKPMLRIFLILVLAVGLLPVGSAMAQAPVVNCATVAASLGASYREGTIGQAKYCLIIPAPNKWNRDVVLFAHGYVPPDPFTMSTAAEIPWDQAIRGDLNLPAILINLGYSFGITSYSKSGLAVKEGVQDIVNLANEVKRIKPQSKRMFLTGVSEGGLVTALAVEQNPATFSGGLETCGPVGSFQGQVTYWSDFRVVFDALFPDVFRAPNPPLYPASTAIYIPPELIAGWAASPSPVAGRVAFALNSNPALTALLLQTTQAPIDQADVAGSIQTTVGGILDYNIRSTDEGRIELGNGAVTLADLPGTNKGSPYTNLGKDYGLPPVFTIDRYTADPNALLEIAKNYETTGKLARPLVLMHTTGDPIVPFWHTSLYIQKAFDAGSIGKVSFIPVQRYGHCSFTPAEAVFGFYVMVINSTLSPFSMQQVQRALPDEKSQKEFLSLKEKGSEKIK